MPFVRWLRRVLGWSRDQSRDVFEYHDGRRRLRAPTLDLWVRLKAAEPEFFSLVSDLAIWQHEAKRAGAMLTPSFDSGCRAFARIVAAVRESFGIRPVEAGGPDDATVFAVLDRFAITLRQLGESLSGRATTTEEAHGRNAR